MTMKRIAILVLAAVLLMGFAACDLFGGSDKVEWDDGTLTVSSDELEPAETVPAGGFYNTYWFEERPLMQSFKFTVNDSWQFTITASGEVDTNFEVYTSIKLEGGPAKGYAYDQLFTMDAETVTRTKERPLAEGHEPPVDVEIKVFFDAPMDWEMVIEEIGE